MAAQMQHRLPNVQTGLVELVPAVENIHPVNGRDFIFETTAIVRRTAANSAERSAKFGAQRLPSAKRAASGPAPPSARVPASPPRLYARAPASAPRHTIQLGHAAQLRLWLFLPETGSICRVSSYKLMILSLGTAKPRCQGVAP